MSLISVGIYSDESESVSQIISNELPFIFRRKKDSSSKVECILTLRITNISGSKIVFKVKTTQPDWYFVRPNQQIINKGKSEDVSIIIQEEMTNNFADYSSQAGGIEKLCEKHRFMIQSKIISDEDYNKIDSMPPALKIDEFKKIWNTEPKDRYNLKLKSVFKYPFNMNENKNTNTNTDNNDNLEFKSAKEKRSTKKFPSENVLEEIITLRAKLDDVVKYSVYLTAERDTIVSQLDDAKNALSSYKTDKSGRLDSPGNNKKDRSKSSSGIEQLLMLFAVVIISYLVGLYVR